jgi:hypothetical protein
MLCCLMLDAVLLLSVVVQHLPACCLLLTALPVTTGGSAATRAHMWHSCMLQAAQQVDVGLPYAGPRLAQVLCTWPSISAGACRMLCARHLVQLAKFRWSYLDNAFEHLPWKVAGLLQCYAELHLLSCRTTAISSTACHVNHCLSWTCPGIS